MNRNYSLTSRQSRLTLSIWCILVSLGVSSCQKKALPGHYDLVAASVTTKTSAIRVGDKVIFDYTVRNDGKDTVPGGTYNVDFYVDGKLVSFDHGTFDKGAGQESGYSMAPGYFHIQPSKPGMYRYRLTVDEKNNVAEIDETNNTLEGDIEVIP